MDWNVKIIEPDVEDPGARAHVFTGGEHAIVEWVTVGGDDGAPAEDVGWTLFLPDGDSTPLGGQRDDVESVRLAALSWLQGHHATQVRDSIAQATGAASAFGELDAARASLDAALSKAQEASGMDAETLLNLVNSGDKNAFLRAVTGKTV